MVLTAKIELKDAQNIKKILRNKDLLDFSYKTTKDKKHIYFPVKKKIKLEGVKFVQKDLKEKKSESNLKDILKNQLSAKELELIPASYDIIGDIAIIEIKKPLLAKEKIIANALLKLHKNLKVVAKKAGIHSGEFRTQELKVLAGEKRKETVYVESGAKIKLDVEKVYFSERLGSERLRIAKEIKDDEKILVMFSGCAPYPLVIEKNSNPSLIVGIEKNPIAHKYGLENLKLNKSKKVELIKGDVKEIALKLKQTFDRILMPLPKSAEDFLEFAVMAGKKGTIIHFYDFLREEEIPKKAIDKIKKKITNFKVLKVVKCGQYSPRKYRICVDLKLL